eukprot:scaffold36535_cov118-Isochrysis_galbana.AAC.4
MAELLGPDGGPWRAFYGPILALIRGRRRHRSASTVKQACLEQASAQFQVRDPTVEREGPVTPLYGPFDCWQPQSTPLDQVIGMPVHPTHIIPLAPMYPPDFDVPTPAPQTPNPQVPQPLRPRRKYLVMFIPR